MAVPSFIHNREPPAKLALALWDAMRAARWAESVIFDSLRVVDDVQLLVGTLASLQSAATRTALPVWRQSISA
jgi:hypothetical protein